MTRNSVTGKVIAITGGARGIGLATAKALAAKGAKVCIGDVDADLACKEAEALGGHGCALDVRDRASFASFLNATVEELGPIDVLINNAGIMPMGAFHEEDPALADAQIDINFRGVINGTQLVIPEMLERGEGHVINVASLAGRFAIPGAAIYAGTKFAVVGLTESLAAEYRDTGIEFTTIMPSKVRTELASGTEAAGKGIPAVDPEDVANAIVQSIVKPKLFVAVPGYLEGVSAVYRLLPERLVKAGRKALGDDRILKDLDKEAHKAYDDRIAGLTRH